MQAAAALTLPMYASHWHILVPYQRPKVLPRSHPMSGVVLPSSARLGVLERDGVVTPTWANFVRQVAAINAGGWRIRGGTRTLQRVREHQGENVRGRQGSCSAAR